MPDLLLWRRLTGTDFDAINGSAAPSGTGGGAMHVALGTDSRAFPIKAFLSAGARQTVTISTQAVPPNIPRGSLTFDGNPARRGGEWRIADQFSHRHPAWRRSVGFPDSYDNSDKPVILIRNNNGTFTASFSSESLLRAIAPSLAAVIDDSSRNSGIVDYDTDWDALANATPAANLSRYTELSASPSADTIAAFDPADVVDGREKILSEVVRRQGQPAFRKSLLKAYERKCAITSCDVEVVLEAAHITPYMGPQTNHPSNGLLLRADLHTLFDLGLVAVNPQTMKVMVSKSLQQSDYWKYNGAKLKVPANAVMAPSQAALTQHRKTFVP